MPRPKPNQPPEAYILTEAGIQYCRQAQIPLRDIRNHAGQTVQGFLWTQVDGSFIERFIAHGLLEGIEIARPEFLSQRKPIMKLVASVFNGILLRRIRPELTNQLQGAQRISQLLGREIKSGHILQAVKHHQTKITSIKSQILGRSRDRIEARTDIGGKEKADRKDSLKKIFRIIADEIWLLYAVSKKPARAEIDVILHRLLDSAVDAMDLSSVVSLIVMEFIQFAEAAHLLNLAERDHFLRQRQLAPAEILANSHMRQRLIERANQNQERLVFTAHLGGEPLNRTNPLTVTLTVRNRGLIGYASRHDFLNKKIRTVKTATFESFLYEMARQGQHDQIALMYLTSLQDLCRKQSIAVEAFTVRDERKDETVSSLKLVI